MRRAKQPEPQNRDGIWYFIRRVPKEFDLLDTRKLVRMSTEIAVVDDPRKVRARKIVEQLNLQLEAYWRGLRDGKSIEAKERFEAAQRRAKTLGVSYQTVEELRAGARLEDMLTRVELLVNRKLVDSEDDVAAVLGGEARPEFHILDMLGEYEKLQSSALAGYSEAQRTRWRNPKIKAAKNFVEAVGSNKLLRETTRADAVTFREWWQAKLIADGLEIGTANKDIGHMNKMWREIDMAHHLGLPQVFSRLRLSGETTGNRAAFSPEEAIAAVLADKLDSLNDEARDIMLIVAELGMRPSEVCGVQAHHIHLSAVVPYVEIKPEDRQLKNPQSERDMPLVGNALAAFRRHPNGFPAYKDKADTLSATVNKAMRLAKLLPTEDHSLYSFRHAFEDRLIEVETPDKVVASLMGHKFQRPKYGKGPTLELKARWLSKVLLPIRGEHAQVPPAETD